MVRGSDGRVAAARTISFPQADSSPCQSTPICKGVAPLARERRASQAGHSQARPGGPHHSVVAGGARAIWPLRCRSLPDIPPAHSRLGVVGVVGVVRVGSLGSSLNSLRRGPPSSSCTARQHKPSLPTRHHPSPRSSRFSGFTAQRLVISWRLLLCASVYPFFEEMETVRCQLPRSHVFLSIKNTSDQVLYFYFLAGSAITTL